MESLFGSNYPCPFYQYSSWDLELQLLANSPDHQSAKANNERAISSLNAKIWNNCNQGQNHLVAISLSSDRKR